MKNHSSEEMNLFKYEIELQSQQAIIVQIDLDTSEQGEGTERKDILQIKSLNEDSTIYFDYQIVEGEIGLEPSSIHFSHSPSRVLKE